MKDIEQDALSDRTRKNLAILETIKKRGPISRTDVSRITRLNIVTVSNYVNSFISKGLIVERGLDASTGGRRPGIIELNPQAGYVIGIDLGLTNIIAVLTDLNASIIAKESIKRLRNDAEASVNNLIEIVGKIIESSKIGRDKISSMCIGASGMIDKTAQTVRCTNGVASINIPIANLLSQRFGIPAELENDATAASFGEWTLGLDGEGGVVLYMYSGVGCGIIINGELYRGVSGTAGEVSLKELLDFSQRWSESATSLMPWAHHLGIPDEAKKLISSGRESKILNYAENILENISLDSVFKAAREKDAVAQDILEKAGEKLGVRIAFLVNLLNPSIVVIGGGLEHGGVILIDAIKKMVKLLAFEEMAEAVKIVPSRLGEDAVALGAASLMIRKFFAQA